VAIKGDTFVEASNTALESHTPTGPNAGTAWSTAGVGAAIRVTGGAGSAIDNSSSNGNRYRLNDDLGSSTMVAQADFALPGAGPYVVALVLRQNASGTGDGNAIELGYDSAVGGWFASSGILTGSSSTAASWPGGTVTLKAVAIGTNAYLYANGVLVHSTTVSSDTGQTRAGLLLLNFNGGAAGIETAANFLAGTLPIVVAAGGATSSVNANTSLACTLSGAPAANDAIYIAFALNSVTSGSFPAVTPPGGFSEIASVNTGAWNRLQVFEKPLATGSEGTSMSVSFPTNTCDVQAIGAVVVRNANQTDPTVETPVTQYDASASTSWSVPGITTAINGSLILTFIATGGDGAGLTGAAQISAWGGGFTEHVDDGVSSEWASIAIASVLKAVAGAFASTTATAASSETNLAITIAIRPAAAVAISLPTPSGALSTSTTATVGATTDTTTGTLYAVVDTAANLAGIAGKFEFGQANGTTLSAIDANWSGDSATLNCQSGVLQCTTTFATRVAYYPGAGNDHASQCVAKASAASGGATPSVQTTAGQTGYTIVMSGTTNLELRRNGVYVADNTPGTGVYDPTVSDTTFKIAIAGTSIKVWVFRGTTDDAEASGTLIINYTDATPLTGGYPGIRVASGTAVTDAAADNWTNFSAAKIKAGQKASGAAALASGNSAVSTTTPSVGVSGLSGSTLYSYALVQNDGTNDSNVLTGTFTTSGWNLTGTGPRVE
jgi:hypothetical protein